MAGELDEMKHAWKAFKHDDAGERFQHARHRMGKRSKAFKAISLAVGIILLAGGLVLCVLPGPGIPLIIFGLALVAARSKPLAKVLDRIEPWLRNRGRAIARRWHAISTGAKASVVGGAALLVVALGTFVWHFVVSPYLLG